MSFLTHLECSLCGRRYPGARLHNLCACGGPLLARYDLAGVARALDPGRLKSRPPTMWRYRELLPVGPDALPVTLGEGFTPLLPCDRLGGRLGLGRLYVKDESRNPTGTFKDRGASCAVSRLRELGAGGVVLATAGNAGAAWAAYSARAGLELQVFVARDAPHTTGGECRVRGATVHQVEGLISEAGAQAAALARERGWFDASTFKEPYRVEGKKTLGLEIAEQLGWRLPSAIVYPTGGGVGLIGMWKAFSELSLLGWAGPPRVRMVAVQAEGCAPVVKALREGRDRVEPWPGARTIASGIRVPNPLAGALILRVLRESGGDAVAVSDGEALDALRWCARTEGLFLCPEAAAALAGLKRLAASGALGAGDTVVLVNTGTGLKHVDLA
ncbi:MAG: threonine synthase [Acetobacteraceae bacterium]|nr:threonine synthase [Acetobacteraceae bacterium]